jgi:(S)-mandelate dehydrogenase
MGRADRCYNFHDFRDAARRALPKGIFDYIDMGTEEGVALAENRSAFDRIRLVPKFLVDLGELDFSTEVLGQRVSWPVGIAPTGITGLLWHQGEVVLAQVAKEAGIPYALANTSITPMAEVARVGGRQWFQVYMWAQEDESFLQIAQARDLGFEALIVTIDSALGRVREHNERNGFDFPFKPNPRAFADMLRHPRWLLGVLGRTTLNSGPPRIANYPERYQRMIAWRPAPKPDRHVTMTWSDLDRIREVWPGPILVKSVLSPEDARRAVDHGAAGVIVSNHGGRSMDSAIATIEALPGIVRAVGDRTTVILDSGVRRGSDVVKALGRGADLVMVGRATLYGVAAGGAHGARRMLDIMRSEFEKTMGYLGCTRISELTEEIFYAAERSAEARPA